MHAAQIQRHLRHTNAVAKRALDLGKHPFGALRAGLDSFTVLAALVAAKVAPPSHWAIF